jgi:hypothetical protein
MSNYKENGLEIFNNVFHSEKLFHSVIKWGEYIITEEFGSSKSHSKDYYKGCEKAKLILTQPLDVRKTYTKGSFVYGYILNNKELIYGGQCSGTGRIDAPSSVGGFTKDNFIPRIPSKKHGKTNVKLFFEVNELIKKGNKIEVFIVKAKDKASVDGFPVKVCEKFMEKSLLTEFETVHNVQPLLNNKNLTKHYTF